MKNKILLILTICFALTNCSQRQSDLSEKRIIDVNFFDSLIKDYKEPSQFFVVNFNKPTIIRGLKGTLLMIDPFNLSTIEGDPIDDKIEVELLELTNQVEFIKARIQTVSDGNIIISGGAYYINMTSNNKQLKLREGKSLKTQFPKIVDEDMILFYGNRDSLGIMNWKKAEVPLLTKKGEDAQDLITEFLGYTGVIDDSIAIALNNYYNDNTFYYQPVELNQFGWINCDRFIDESDLTELHCTFDPKDSIISASLHLVFKEINSVVNKYYISHQDNPLSKVFKGIPIGNNVRLIVYSIKDSKILLYSSDFSITENQNINIVLKVSSKEELIRQLLSNE